MPSFAELGLLPELLKAVAEQGYTEPTPIQVQAIPLVLQGRDVMGGAQTGTGKTAGFTLPLLQRLARHASTSHSPARHPVRALILTPTRELAAQVAESVRIYGKYIGLRSAVVFGGIDMKPQTAALRLGVEFLVATPGRLLDHVQQKTVNLQQVEAFVLDEADRMLDMGFIPDVRRIMALLPKQRQNLLFSATLTGEIRVLADSFLRDPVLVQVARNNAAAEAVTHLVHPARRERKRELLSYLIQSRDLRQVLVFTSTRIGANRLAYQLNRDGIHTAAIHGDKTQPERLQALADFKEGKVRVLVATDVAARGLDIEDLPHVVNFELPGAPEDYVHRIGRTGRAGTEGEAVSLVSPEDRPLMAAIEKLMNRKVEQRVIEGFEPGTRGEPSQEQPRREQRQPQRRPQQQQRHSRGQQQFRRGNGQQAPRANGAQAPRGNGGQPQASRGNGQQPPRRGPQPQHRSGRRSGGQGYVSPELQAQIEEGRQRARQDAREHPVERERAEQQAAAPAPKPAPTVTHRASRGIRRVLGSLLGGNGNKDDSGT